MSYIFQKGYWCNIIVLNVMHQVTRKMMIQNRVFMSN